MPPNTFKKISYHVKKRLGKKYWYISSPTPTVPVIIALIKALGTIKYTGSLEVLYDTIWTEGYGEIIKKEALNSIDLIMNQTKK